MINKIKKEIPNVITLGNLLCGCLGIYFIFKGDESLAGYMIIVAAVLDFFDGFVARLLKVQSPLGKELDSLADVVTFGVLPGFILLKIMIDDSLSELNIEPLFAYTAFLVPLFSAYRLAKFNIDARQSDRFIGVPTPANGMVVASFALIMNQNPDGFIGNILLNHEEYVAIYAVIISILLVAEIPLIALKFKKFNLKDNIFRYLLIFSSIILIVLLQIESIPYIFIVYFLVSLLENLTTNKLK